MPLSAVFRRRLQRQAAALVLATGLVLAAAPLPAAAQQVVYPSPMQQAQTGQWQAQNILNRLLAANNVPAESVRQISLVESSQLNAATDGRRIWFTTALWNALKSDDQRAFVIAHELAHVVAGHVPKTQARRLGLAALDQYVLGRLVESNSRWWAVARQAGVTLVDMKFSRNAEYQADDLGLSLMSRAGYNPQAAVETLRLLQAAAGRSAMPEFLQNHPLNEARIQALSKKHQGEYRQNAI